MQSIHFSPDDNPSQAGSFVIDNLTIGSGSTSIPSEGFGDDDEGSGLPDGPALPDDDEGPMLN